jgi:uncharacterized protein YndB with AHSA1/START domain
VKFTNVVTINRPRPVVFAYLAHLENIPRWNYAISQTRKLTSGPVGVGTRYHQIRTLPTPSEETFEVVEFEPDRRLSIDGGLGPFRGRVAYILESGNASTTLTNTMDLRPSAPLGVVARLAAPQARSAVMANLNTLKQLLESGTAAA